MTGLKKMIIVDDSRTFQRVIHDLLAPHFEIVGKGSNGIEGFDLYQRFKPEVVLMDVTMPNCSGKECLQKIMEFDPAARVVMISGIGDENTVKECINLGAKAFVKKADISLENLEESVLLRTVLGAVGVTGEGRSS